MSNNPYGEALGHREPFQVLGETPKKLSDMLNGLSKEQAGKQPAPGKWSLREIMAHLADCEIVWAWRLRLAFEKENAHLEPFNQDNWARRYDAYRFEQARLTFDALRAWNLAFLSGLTEEDKRRSAKHPERGELTLWNIVETMAGHDLHHLTLLEKQLQQLRAAV